MFTQNRANNFSAKAEFVFKDKLLDIKPLEYNIQNFTIPATSIAPISIGKGNSTGNIPGDVLEQEQSLELEFILDEELEVLFTLQEIQNVNVGMGRSEDLFIANILNHKNKVIATGSFERVWIERIGSIAYSTKGEDTTVFLPVTISYLNFTLKKVS